MSWQGSVEWGSWYSNGSSGETFSLERVFWQDGHATWKPTVRGKILKLHLKKRLTLLEWVTFLLKSFLRQKLLHHQICFLLKQVCDRSKLSFASLGREIPSLSSNMGQNQNSSFPTKWKFQILARDNHPLSWEDHNANRQKEAETGVALSWFFTWETELKQENTFKRALSNIDLYLGPNRYLRACHLSCLEFIKRQWFLVSPAPAFKGLSRSGNTAVKDGLGHF